MEFCAIPAPKEGQTAQELWWAGTLRGAAPFKQFAGTTVNGVVPADFIS